MKLNVSRNNVRRAAAVVLTVVAIIGASYSVLAGDESEPEQPSKALEITPIFGRSSNAHSGPLFSVSYQDNTKDVNVPELLKVSSMVLDGKTYKCLGVVWRGFDILQRGTSWSLTIYVFNYDLPKKQVYDQERKLWRWEKVLSPGKHTVTFMIGDKQYEPVDFIWRE